MRATDARAAAITAVSLTRVERPPSSTTRPLTSTVSGSRAVPERDELVRGIDARDRAPPRRAAG